MPTAKRYEERFPGRFPRLSQEAAAAPYKAISEVGRVIKEMGQDITRREQALEERKREAAREIEVPKRLSQAQVSMERWQLQQTPYDADGKPRYDSFSTEWEEQWQAVRAQALEGVEDPETQRRIEVGLIRYETAKRQEIAQQASKWEIQHRQKELAETMRNYEEMATILPQALDTYVSMADAALAEAVRTGVISGEEGVRQFEQFTRTATMNRVQGKIYGGDFLGAADDIRALRRFDKDAVLPPMQVHQLEAELNNEIDRILREEDAAAKNMQETAALKFLLDVSAGVRPPSDLDLIAGEGKLITDPDMYLKLRRAVTEKSSKDTDDPMAVRAWAEIVARGEATVDKLLSFRDKLTEQTYLSFAHDVVTQQANKKVAKDPGAPDELFQDPFFKDARAYIEERLRVSGRWADKLTWVEQYVIPQALREFTSDMLTEWRQSGGRLSYDVTMNHAENLVSRLSQTIPMSDKITERYPVVPAYKNIAEIEAAFKSGAFGAPGSSGARARMTDEIRKLHLWDSHLQAKSKAEEAKKAPQNTLEETGGGWLKRWFGKD